MSRLILAFQTENPWENHTLDFTAIVNNFGNNNHMAERNSTEKNRGKKLIWDFEYRMRKTTSARRPDLSLTLEGLDERKKKLRGKKTKYQRLEFEIRERRPDYIVEVIPFVIGCLGGGMKKLEEQMAKLNPEQLRRLRITREIQKIVLMESETIVKKIISGIVQPVTVAS